MVAGGALMRPMYTEVYQQEDGGSGNNTEGSGSGGGTVMFGTISGRGVYGEVGVGRRDVYLGAGVSARNGARIGAERQSDVSSGLVVKPTRAGLRVGVMETIDGLGENLNDAYLDFLNDTGLRRIPSLTYSQ